MPTITRARARASATMTKGQVTASLDLRFQAPIANAAAIDATSLDDALRTQLQGIRTALEGDGWTVTGGAIDRVTIDHIEQPEEPQP